jgi:protein involved in polysaccharide export with SLBB domain
MRRALCFALAFAWTSAYAQTGTYSAPAAPPVAVQPVQTPVITNAPADPRLLELVPAEQRDAERAFRPGDDRDLRRADERARRRADARVIEAPRAEAPPPPTDFQELIFRSTGERLPLYGYDLFRAPSTFAPLENVPVTPDYLIGPGDELMIRAWGQIDIDYRATVDRNGAVNIPRVGTIQVAGLKYVELTPVVKQAVQKNFRNFELLVTLGQLRSIQVFVVGRAARPGAYTVSSLSTLVNAVFAAGGPSVTGSMRAIQLKRGAEVVTEFDLYDLLLRGDKSKDAALLPGDVIYFPPAGPLAAVSGNVKNPAIYELKGPASVVALLDYAGGLSTTAQTKNVTIERIENRGARVVDKFALDAGGMARTVKDGDLVSIYPISPRFENAVTLRGNVALPLRHPYKEGMRIRDLIPDKEVLVTRDYHLRKNSVLRTDSERDANDALRPESERDANDALRPGSARSANADKDDFVARDGTRRRSTTVAAGELAASVRRLFDEINWDYAVIERQNEQDLSSILIPFDLGKVVLEGDPAHNLPLKPGDIVTVFSKSDINAPAGRRPVVVQLQGEFNNAGVYQALQGETLRQLIVRVGGLTRQAYLFGAEFTRESTRKQQEERLRQALVQFEQDLQRAAAARARNVTSAEDAASLKAEAEAQESILARLKRVQPTGRIVLELPAEPALADLPELPLEDGDRISVPQRPAMVSVFGSVYSESAFVHKPEKTVTDYLEQAGGPKREADRRNMFLLRADGSVVPNKGGWFGSGQLASLTPLPGDSIIVPEDLQRTTLTKNLKDWTQIFFQFGLGATALKVISD